MFAAGSEGDAWSMSNRSAQLLRALRWHDAAACTWGADGAHDAERRRRLERALRSAELDEAIERAERWYRDQEDELRALDRSASRAVARLVAGHHIDPSTAWSHPDAQWTGAKAAAAPGRKKIAPTISAPADSGTSRSRPRATDDGGLEKARAAGLRPACAAVRSCRGARRAETRQYARKAVESH